MSNNVSPHIFHLQKSMKKSDDSNAADIGVYQDIRNVTDPSGKMCCCCCTNQSGTNLFVQNQVLSFGLN